VAGANDVKPYKAVLRCKRQHNPVFPTLLATSVISSVSPGHFAYTPLNWSWRTVQGLVKGGRAKSNNKFTCTLDTILKRYAVLAAFKVETIYVWRHYVPPQPSVARQSSVHQHTLCHQRDSTLILIVPWSRLQIVTNRFIPRWALMKPVNYEDISEWWLW
jgi:hypothetical protein